MSTTHTYRVAVIMGGYSSEYDISLKSGETVIRHLDTQKYRAYRIIITPEKWFYRDDNGTEYPVDKSDFSVSIDGEKIHFDVVFNAIHGHPGEDGAILAYLEILGIPHTSDSSYLMALTFNKNDCIAVLSPHGIPHGKSIRIRKGEQPDENQIEKITGYPCFVKSNRAGSSYGVSKVNKPSELQEALQKAFEEDDEVLIEEFLDGTEVSVGVITYGDKIIVLPPTEIVSENEFFDYEAKYLGLSKEITPARIDESLTETVKNTAAEVYRILGMKGMSRAEYILRDGIPYFLEINTVPGLTAESILPKQLDVAGISLSGLFDSLITQALKK